MHKGVQQASAWILSLGLHSLVVLGLMWGMRWTPHPEPIGAQAELWLALPHAEVVSLSPPMPSPILPPPKVASLPQPAIAFKEKKRPQKKQTASLAQPLPSVSATKVKPQPPRAVAVSTQKHRNSPTQEAPHSLPNSLASIGASSHGTASASKAGKPKLGLGGWERQARQRIRRQIQLPDTLEGNPEAIFEVTLSRSMEVLHIRQIKSSGFPDYDAAVREAIERVSSFPALPDENLFAQVQRTRLKFRPRE